MSKETLIVIDSSGRGAALVDAYAKSPHVERIIAIPGNDLMQVNTDKEVVTHQNLKTTSVEEIVNIAKDEKVILVDVAQDNAVEAGLVDALVKAGITTVGPTRAAGQIEWDKAWAREFGEKYGLPQPAFKECHSLQEGLEFIQNQKEDRSWFIKASGLAEGKGALPAENNKEAIERIKELVEKFSEAAKTYLIEEWLVGEEFSTFIFCDGSNYKIIESAQDHKRVFDGDKGENTGGMGCSTPPLVLTPDLMKKVEEKIISKAVKGLVSEGRSYKGVLYLGGILVERNEVKEPYVIEFNARWGDPEAEVIVPSITTDLFLISKAIIEGTIDKVEIKADGKARVVVAGTSKGYPGSYQKRKEILGLEEVIKSGKVKIYGAGIKKQDGKYLTNGGRIFYIVGEGKNVLEAREKAYEAMSKISIEDNGLHYRKDIGWRDVERLQKKSP